MNIRLGAALAAVAILPGCEAAGDRSARLHAFMDFNLNRYQGKTVAEFMAATPDLRAVDYYGVDDGRVFRFAGYGGSLIYPGGTAAPTVVQSISCQVDVSARPNGGSGASGWTVTAIRHSGACDNLRVL